FLHFRRLRQTRDAVVNVQALHQKLQECHLLRTGFGVIVGTISLPPSLIEEAVGPEDPSIVNAAQYFRIATFCSFLNMLIGFSPKMFTNLLNRVEMLAGEEAD
ncbi:MAG: hypothetical protein AAF564_22895, partial [Bacteroidota bacterium]